MNEASDTVMTPEQLSLICGCPVDMICSAGDYEWKIAKAQAELSFPRGRKVGFEEGRKEGRKEGIREGREKMTGELVTVEEAAKILKVRRETIRRYIKSGYLQALTLPGGDYRLRERDMQKLLSRPSGKENNEIIQEVLRTSEEWQTLLGVEVLSPDGWDRQNLEYSFYQEQITRKEFEKRLDTSTTCRM